MQLYMKTYVKKQKQKQLVDVFVICLVMDLINLAYDASSVLAIKVVPRKVIFEND